MMDRDAIAQTLAGILRANLNDATLVVTPETLPGQVAGWSSIKMVDIVLDAEDAFNVRLSAEDIDGVRTVDDLVEAVARHCTRV